MNYLAASNAKRRLAVTLSLGYLLGFHSAALHAQPQAAKTAADPAPPPIVVAVAANFSAPLQAIAAEFEKTSGHTVSVVAGSTGKLFAQITNGAPFDVFLAADTDAPAKLDAMGLAVKGSRFTYATGRLVLWSAKPGFVDADGAVLKQGTFSHLAIAAPKLAPYGAAAYQVLTQLGVLAQLEAKIVQGESIGQAYAMVASGNAELGFVAWSQVFAGGQMGRGSAWLVPENLHKPLHQDAILIARKQLKSPALALLAYLKTDKARAIMRSFGYGA